MRFLLLSLFLFCLCGPGQAKPPGLPVGNAGAARLAAEMDPSSWSLGPEATHLYYYLLLAEGMATDSQTVISESLKGLIRLDPSLAIYQDAVTIMLSRDEYAEAERLAREGLGLFPDDPLLLYLLSVGYSENDQIPKAIALLEKHLELNPDSHEAMEQLVRLYLKEGQDKKAAALLSKIPEKPRDPDSELFRARVLTSVGRYKEARESLLRLLNEDSRQYEIWLELAFLAEQQKESDEAVKAYRKALEFAPDNPEILFRIAAIQIQSKLPKEALESLERAAPSPGLYIQAALRFASGKYYDEAEQMLQKAQANGANPDEIALFRAMLVQESSSNPLDSLKILETIPPRSKLYPNALEQRVRVYLLAKEYSKALEAAQEGRGLFPDRRDLWGLEAFALVKLKEGPEAEKLLRQALERYPDDEQILFSLGSVLDENEKKPEAMDIMRRIISVNPKHYDALNYVGYTLAEKNQDLEEAHKLIKAALEQSPDADYIVDSLAWVQYRLGQFDAAWETINRCIELGGDDATMWEHFGDIALALNKKAEAVKGYTEALVRQPDNTAELRKKLTKLQSP